MQRPCSVPASVPHESFKARALCVVLSSSATVCVDAPKTQALYVCEVTCSSTCEQFGATVQPARHSYTVIYPRLQSTTAQPTFLELAVTVEGLWWLQDATVEVKLAAGRTSFQQQGTIISRSSSK
jgi:hypothetical protein